MGFYIIGLEVEPYNEAVKTVRGISGTIKKAVAYFPLNAGGFLYCKFIIGNMIFPTVHEEAEELITADNIVVELPVEEGYTLAAGEKIVIYGKNYDAANPHSVFLWLYIE